MKEFFIQEIPKALDHVLGKRIASRFKVVPGNTHYSISQLSQDKALINSIVAKLPTFDLQVRLNELLAI